MILISACLAGIPCRYDGKSKKMEKMRMLVEKKKAVPVCPEVLGGLGIPRLPAELRDGKVFTIDGNDVTVAYETGCRKALEICLKNRCEKAYLKEKSPACGVHKIYNGSFMGKTISGQGIFTSLLRRNGIQCFNEYEYEENEQ